MDELHCQAPVTRVFRVLGKRWTGPLLSILLQRPAHFAELARAVTGLSERMLSERLQELIEAGLAERRVEPGPPLGTLYRLTPAGEGLRPAMDALAAWAQSWPLVGQPTGAEPSTAACSADPSVDERDCF